MERGHRLLQIHVLGRVSIYNNTTLLLFYSSSSDNMTGLMAILVHDNA